LPQVPELLDIRLRRWPDGEDTLSFSALGLWACGGLPRVFEGWWENAVRRNHLIEGQHFIRLTGGDSAVDVCHAHFVATFSTAAGLEAARVIAVAVRSIRIALSNSAAPVPHAMRAMIAAAEIVANTPVVERRPAIRMSDGSKREVADPPAVEALLDIDLRILAGALVPTVSVRGLWSCTASMSHALEWFGSEVKTHRLIEGEDYVGRLDEGGDAFLDARHVRTLLRALGPEACKVAIALAEAPVKAARVPGDGRSREDLPGPGRAAAEGGDQREEVSSVEAGDVGGPDADVIFDFARLVPVTERRIGDRTVLAVDARDLHVFLGSGRQFANWLDELAIRCRLIEGVDYDDGFTNKGAKNPRRGRPRSRDRVLTLDAAKEVALASPGARGRMVRQYFIEQERRVLAGEPPIPGSVSMSAAVGRNFTVASIPSLPDRCFPLTLAEFLRLVGLSSAEASAIGAAHERALLLCLVNSDAGDHVGRHPVTRHLCFTRAALDAWWGREAASLLCGGNLQGGGGELSTDA
jgi:phage anti-repressor protein